MSRIVIHCIANGVWARRDGHHRWETVPGTMSTPDHPYTERRCVRCRCYESEVRCPRPPRTTAGRRAAAAVLTLSDAYFADAAVARRMAAAIDAIDPLAIENEAAVPTGIDWPEVLLDALCASDGGNNPFYRDDDDTVSLANELAAVVVTRLRGTT